jgi:hypothetical protein
MIAKPRTTPVAVEITLVTMEVLGSKSSSLKLKQYL